MKHWLEEELTKVNWKRVWLVVLIAWTVMFIASGAIAGYILGE